MLNRLNQSKYFIISGRVFAYGLAIVGLAELIRSFVALFDPLSNDYSEMIVAGMSRQLQLTKSLAAIYAPPDAPYHLPGVQYPPLFMCFGAVLLALTHLSPLLAARLLAWFGYAGSGLLVGLLVWQETRQRWAALVAAFLPFNFWSVIIFINAARPDPLALLFSLCAAFYYRRYQLKRIKLDASPLLSATNWWQNFGELLPVVLLCWLAFFTKQTYIAVSAGVFFDLLLRRGQRFYALLFGLVLGSLVGSGLLLFNLLSQGTFMAIFDPARADRFIFDKAPSFIQIFLTDHAALLLIALLVLWIVGRYNPYQRFWLLYFFFAVLGCVSIVKDGAVDYYFNEVAYLTCVLVGLALAWWLKKIEKLRWRNWLLPLLLAVQFGVAIVMFIGWGLTANYDNFRQAYNSGLQLVAQAQAKHQPTLIFADNLLLATDQTDLICDYFIYSILVEDKHADPTSLLTDLQRHRYSLIITENFYSWPPVFNAAIQQNYSMHYLNGKNKQHLFKVYVLKPLGAVHILTSNQDRD